MRQDIIENVEIVEPPIEELTKRHSSLRKTCLTGSGCIVLFILAIALVVRIYIGSGPETLKSVPAYFPKDIPSYAPDNIDQITHISGQYKNRSIEIAAIVPKIILSPLFLALNRDPSSTNNSHSFKNLWQFIATPVGDNRDTVQIEWKDMDADPNFVISYYKTELGKRNFKITDTEGLKNNAQEFSFDREDHIDGSLYVEPGKSGTSYADLIVNFVK